MANQSDSTELVKNAIPPCPAIPSTAGSFSSITCPAVGIKLTGDNYIIWKARLLPFLRASQLLSIVDGTEPCPPQTITETGEDGVTKSSPNPTYDKWFTRDQIALGWILNSTADNIVAQLSHIGSSTEVWSFLASSYVAQNSARATHLRMQLQTLRKGNQTITEFLQQATFLVDQLASIGENISSQEYQTHLFKGLGAEYQNLAVSISVQSQHQPLTRESLHGLLLAHEARLDLLEPINSTLAAFMTRTSYQASQQQIPSHVDRSPRFRQQSQQSMQHFGPQSSTPKYSTNANNYRTPRRGSVRCQLFNRFGHRANVCRDRGSPPQHSGSAPQLHIAEFSPPPLVFPDSRYPDFSATHHVTNNPSLFSPI